MRTVVWAVDYGDSLVLAEVDDDSGATSLKHLEITLDVGDDELTIRLDGHGARNLRLALQRFERTRR